MKLNANHTSASIDLHRDFSAGELEDLILELAILRSRMTPHVPKVPPHGSHGSQDRAVLFADDAQMVVARLDDGRVRFWMRNSGLGWCAYHVPELTARGVQHFLAAKLPGTRPAIDIFIG